MLLLSCCVAAWGRITSRPRPWGVRALTNLLAKQTPEVGVEPLYRLCSGEQRKRVAP